MRINQQIVSGFLGGEIETHKFKNGDEVGRFSINDDNGYWNKQKKEWVDMSSWHYVQVPGWMLKDVRSLTKGSKVILVGRTVRKQKQQEDGTQRDYVYIVAESIEQLIHNK